MTNWQPKDPRRLPAACDRLITAARNGHDPETIGKYAGLRVKFNFQESFPMLKRFAGGAALAAALLSAPAQAADITGAGATFPYPIYANWADAHNKAPGIGLNYQSIDSARGIRHITPKTADFGASNLPTTQARR